MLRNYGRDIHNNMETAVAIGQAYMASQQNAMGGQAWAGGGADSSAQTAAMVQESLQKILNGGMRLTEGLNQAAGLMESHEQDGSHAFQALFGAHSTSV